MLGRQERLAIMLLLIVSVIVISSHLILEHIGKRPFATEFSEQSKEGDLVILSGTIDSVTLTNAGSHCILMVDKLTIFIPNQIAAGQTFTPGTAVTVIGTVQTFQGKKEVVVESASDIILTVTDSIHDHPENDQYS